MMSLTLPTPQSSKIQREIALLDRTNKLLPRAACELSSALSGPRTAPARTEHNGTSELRQLPAQNPAQNPAAFSPGRSPHTPPSRASHGGAAPNRRGPPGLGRSPPAPWLLSGPPLPRPGPPREASSQPGSARPPAALTPVSER